MYPPKTFSLELNKNHTKLRDINRVIKRPKDIYSGWSIKFPQVTVDSAFSKNHNKARSVAKDDKGPKTEWLDINKFDEVLPNFHTSDPSIASVRRGFPTIRTSASVTPQATAVSHHNTQHTVAITALQVIISAIAISACFLFLYFIYLVIILPLCKGAKRIFKRLSNHLHRSDLESGGIITLHELIDNADIPPYGLNPPLSLPVYPARVYRVGRYTGDDCQRSERGGGGNWIASVRGRGSELVRTDSNATQWESDLSPAVLLTGMREGVGVLPSNLRPVVPADEDEVMGRGKWNESVETLVRTRSYVSVLSLA
ncbi:hypothetical protein HYFRA_00001244 [Hymenoscyphus fraxineus]|uniref:Uncharacterized protein n=1 Tax=Hymenoscyphus fraxineus TaxID=746836 RepID=A0A9N9KVY4_9HELO|nr:hypothetical protein HYFRA_00001244 [Hymenoscyphus fraxineus]